MTFGSSKVIRVYAGHAFNTRVSDFVKYSRAKLVEKNNCSSSIPGLRVIYTSVIPSLYLLLRCMSLSYTKLYITIKAQPKESL